MTFQERLTIAFKLFEEQKLDESLTCYQELLSENLSIDEEINVRLGYGYPLSKSGLTEEAVENYLLLKNLGEETSNLDIVSQSLHQLGMVYRHANRYGKALKMFNKERDFIKLHFNTHSLYKAANYYEIGYMNLQIKNYKNAINFLSKSLEEAFKSGDSIMIACSQRGLGEYYANIEEIPVALDYFTESIHSFKNASDELGTLEVKKLIYEIKRLHN